MNDKDRVERINSNLMALYDERTELEMDINLYGDMGEPTDHYEEVLHDLNHSIKILENQIKEYEVQHLDQMKEAV